MRRLLKVLRVCGLIVLTGCVGNVPSHDEAVESVKHGERRDELVPSGWSAAESGGVVDDGWLKSFDDPQLMAIVEEAQRNNFGLKIAQAEVEQANGLARRAGAGLKPSVGLSGGYADRSSEGRTEIYGGGLRISWEADVWGRVRSGIRASEERAGATRSDYEFARQSLAAATANGWFLATGAKIITGYADEIVQLLEETVRIAEVKQQVGKGSMRDVHLARAEQAQAREAARKALAAQEDAKRSLELLLGRFPGAELETRESLPAVPPPVAAGIPSALLERRPDIIAAERDVAAAFYKQREAELMQLPTFSFSMGLGLSSLTDAASSLAAGIFAPLYTGGAIEAEVDVATAEQKQAIAAYAQKALQAFKEVESALAAEEHLLRQEEYLQTVVDENYTAYTLTKKQYEVGKIDLLDVLSVQNKWVQARIAHADVATRRLINRVGLHLALGGSFEKPDGQ